MNESHIVKSYDADLQHLQLAILNMGDAVRKQIQDALTSLSEMDLALASHVTDNDHQIDQMEAHIDQMALQILVLRQPVAFDLRIVIASLKMANHFERIADYGANISRRVLMMDAQQPLLRKPPVLLFRMGELVQQMMSAVQKAFQAQSRDAAKKAWKEDEEVDQLYNALLRELLTYMMEDPRCIGLSAHYLFIAKNIERIGDHVTNLAEIIAVMVRGKPLKELRTHSTESFEIKPL